MKLRQDIALRQQTRLTLSQDLVRAIGLLGLSNLDLGESLREAAAENPFLRLELPRAAALEDVEIADEGPSLIAHVLECLPGLVPAPADRAVALALAEALDAQGFLATPTPAIAARLGLPPARVEAVLAQLQRIEPRGLFARSLAECLALQLAEEGPIAPEMRRVLEALPALAEGGPAALARATGLPPDMLAPLLAQLRGLSPRPAAGFATPPARARIADLVFAPEGTGWAVRLNRETAPRLTLAAITGPARERRAAQALIAAVERRNAALLALGTALAREQPGFLRDGPAALRPLTRRAVAAAIGLHESTVSRMVAAGSAETPRGTEPLAAFFGRAVAQAENAEAGPAVIARIRALVGAEHPSAPLTDGALAEALAQAGITVSRRVVAKLRARAGIPPRALRRR